MSRSGTSHDRSTVCVHVPRFELRVACGGARELLGAAVAIAPSGAAAMRIGEVSASAQAQGVQPGMALGEALACCPKLQLVPGDPIRVHDAWEQAACALEGIGAQVEFDRPGLAYFDAAGLQRLHGGLDGVISAAGNALRRRPRIGAGSTRFCALAAALQARARRAKVVAEWKTRDYLARQPVSILRYRSETEPAVPALERLGVSTLGDLVKLGPDAVADRFGEPGTVARRLALAHDEPLRPRRVEDQLTESMKLAEANSGLLLQRTLEVLVNRLLARPQRRARTIRALILSARLVERGTWREHVTLREAIADPHRILLALATPLQLLPAPAIALELTVAEFGPATGDQRTLLDGERTARDARRRKAVRQVRALAGPNALLHVLVVAPDSPLPEHRTLSTPWSG